MKRGQPAVHQAGRAVIHFPSRGADRDNQLRAKAYPVRVPDGEYLAICTRVFGPHRSRAYGTKIYLVFEVIDGEHLGKKLPMFLRPSNFPTSNLYRSWCLANDGPPSRNARLSPRIFLGKTFRIRTCTVRPRHRVTGPDGKLRAGDLLPDFLWYSRVNYLISLEISPQRWDTVTEISRKSFSDSAVSTGGVGSRKPETGSETCAGSFQVLRGGSPVGTTNQAGGKPGLPAGPTPVNQTTIALALSVTGQLAKGNDLVSKQDFESVIYRRKLFELYDYLPPSFSHKKRVDHVLEKAVSEVFLNRGRELEGVDESAVLEAARKRVTRFSDFETIRDQEKRRRVVVGCVVNATAEAALAKLKEKHAKAGGSESRR